MQRADMIKGGMTPADARHAIEPQIIKAMLEGQNRLYAVIDGTTIYMPGTRLVSVCSSAVLASDGYPHSAAHAPRHRKGAGKTTRRRPAEHPQLCGYERSR